MANLPYLFQLQPAIQIAKFDTSTRRATYRVELADGSQFQINENLCSLLECLRTPLSLEKLASTFQEVTGQVVAVEQLQTLTDQLIKQGLVITPGSVDENNVQPQQVSNSYLSLHWRRDLFSAQLLSPLTNILQVLYWPPLAIVLLSITAITLVSVYVQVGFPPDLDMTAISWPLFYILLLFSILCHELGHLSACRRWNCPHGALGIGLYFFNPVFYADVSAAWRLTRRQRVVVDVGGMYFQLLIMPLWLWLWATTQDPTCFLMIIATIGAIFSNLEPLIKLDGYWLLSDLTGVPNLHKRTGELIYLGWQWLNWWLGRGLERPTLSVFSQWPCWVQIVIFIYVGLSIVLWPLMIFIILPLLIQMIKEYPGLWIHALPIVVKAIRTGNLPLLFDQLQILFLPTLAILNMGYLLKLMMNRQKQNEQL